MKDWGGSGMGLGMLGSVKSIGEDLGNIKGWDVEAEGSIDGSVCQCVEMLISGNIFRKCQRLGRNYRKFCSMKTLTPSRSSSICWTNSTTLPFAVCPFQRLP